VELVVGEVVVLDNWAYSGMEDHYHYHHHHHHHHYYSYRETHLNTYPYHHRQ